MGKRAGAMESQRLAGATWARASQRRSASWHAWINRSVSMWCSEWIVDIARNTQHVRGSKMSSPPSQLGGRTPWPNDEGDDTDTGHLHEETARAHRFIRSVMRARRDK